MDISYIKQWIINYNTGQNCPPIDSEKSGEFFDGLQFLANNTHSAQSRRLAFRGFALQYCESHPTEAKAIGLASALKFQLRHGDELEDLEPPKFLYEDMIVTGGLHVVFGQSGAHKSFVTLDIAAKVAQEHPVIYAASEGFTGNQDRLAAWKQHHRQGSGQLHFLEQTIELLNEASVQEFIEGIVMQTQAPALIVIDTLAWSLQGGDENSARDVGIAMNQCRKIQKATGAAVLLVHHTGKNGVSERGSSALRGAADMMIKVENFDGLIKVSCDKSKDFAPFEDKYFKPLSIDIGDRRNSLVIEPTDKFVSLPSDKLTPNQHTILEFIGMEKFWEHGANLADIKSECGVGHVHRVLNELLKRGYLTQGKRGDPYTITEAGKQKLGIVSNPTGRQAVKGVAA